MEFAICKLAFSQMRPGPSHRSELISQLRFGEPVKLIETGDDWSLVCTEHGYEGFVRTAHLVELSRSDFSGFIGLLGKNESDGLSLPLSAGAFCWKGTSGIEDFTSRHDPNGAPLTGADFGASICQMAMGFLDVPYVWGGKTAWGLDCSGLVQLVLNIAGFSFPRDAWQQAEAGKEIAFNSALPTAEAGDLLFFRHGEKRIHHVGISLGGSKFIHASEWVRINSLNPSENDFAADRLSSLCAVKRLQTELLLPLRKAIESLFTN